MIKVQSSKFKVQRVLLFLLFTIHCSLFTVSPAIAGDKVITISEAYDLALKSHEKIKIAEEDLEQADIGVDKALSQLLPTMTAEGTHTKYTKEKTSSLTVIQPDNSSTFSLKFSQPLYTGGKEWSARRQAKKKVDSNKEGLDFVKEGIVFDVSNAYYNLLKAEKDKDIKEAALQRAKEQTKVAKARLDVGDVTKSVLLRAEAEEAGANAELAKSLAALDIARTKLARLIGTPPDFKVRPPSPMSTPKNIDGIILNVFDKRRDYIQAKIDEEIAKEGITYAKGNFMPSLKLDGTYSRRDQDPISSSFFNKESIYGTITLSLPFFEGGLRSAELKESKSKLRQAELKRLNLKRDIEQDIRETFYNITAIASTINSYERQVLFAEENYKMVFKQFQYGLATNVDVVDANATVISAQKGLANATYDLQISIIGLKKKTGELLDETLASK
ncbi:MAG: TolC family protein [Deltaproteobacteria bacterium]|nr:TolC family protein [Deltaproteobacteria bacterium]